MDSTFKPDLLIPDLWQQEAVRHLLAGRDLVVHAPTGAGKTYIFELFVDQGLRKQAIFTVPTRALANDKLMEWREKGWDVGICTGDIVENPDARVLVATLETQKGLFLRGKGPGLLVIDEYQMLADPVRGVNYELALATVPAGTQILILSGSVSNPQDLVAWLNRIGRDAVLLRHTQRSVPQEEVFVEQLKIKVPQRIRGYWPRIVTKALVANLGPLLIFAPYRSAAETLAKQLCKELPVDEYLLLSPEQQRLAGRSLSRLLKTRIAYHHSGLSYLQRAGVIEPLAKAGQLRVVVATMGLASGINFSMRSVAVADTEYRVGHRIHRVRPDELLQMFGRAGRRGRDTRGYTLVVPGKPRAYMASALKLRRVNQVDWPSLIGVMAAANERGEDPLTAARKLTERLFSEQVVSLGLESFIARREKNRLLQPKLNDARKQRSIEEFKNVEGVWERKKAPVKAPLGKTLLYQDGTWVPALSISKTLRVAGEGQVCLITDTPEKRYGREIPLASWSKDEDKKDIVLTKWLRKRLAKHKPNGKRPTSRYWYYDPFERIILSQIPVLTGGGKLVEVVERKGTLYGRIDFSDAVVFATKDAQDNFLLGAPRREHVVEDIGSFAAHVLEQESGDMGGLSPTQAWFRLGLIDWEGKPTRRGRIFSYFNYGEGLAIAAALEEKSYEISELVFDLANLRAGHRFGDFESFSSRLGSVCRATYGNATFEGYLEKGMPSDYGEGAAEVLVRYEAQQGDMLQGEGVLLGDVERVRLEWISLLRHTARAPDFDWERWRALQAEAEKLLFSREAQQSLVEVPPLTPVQKQKIEHHIRLSK
ncbi:MAG: DEAD/DEAH box helicase [Verrucomicrobia bacterium]|nr:DEAD/DEAH box helicase [Verrucomicrobiota bacterium]